VTHYSRFTYLAQIYQDSINKVIYGGRVAPTHMQLVGEPQYLGEHLNRIADQKAIEGKRLAEDKTKNFEFN
jgi:hypothetical protein